VAGRSPAKSATSSKTQGASKGAKKPDMRQAVVGLALALAIVVAAWFIGGRAGFGEIGEGGINRQFLPEVGEAAPDFVALDSTATGVWLHDFKGKPVWLTFWGSWCPPCRSEMPEIEAAYKQLAPEGLVLMAVSVDEPFDVSLAFAQALGATFPILNVPDRDLIADRYDVYNYPTHIFIDENGIVQKIIPGQLDTETALAEGRALLSRSTTASTS
jgi:peroxiredoxin